MKIALPEHQGRIAPVFDTCLRILVFAQDQEDQGPIAQEDWSMVDRRDRVTRLEELDVDVLLCGGISCSVEDQICLRGIRLVAWLAGDVPKILKAFRDGTIMDAEFAMPGTFLCRRRRQMRRMKRPVE
ncbi:MAG TPA: hypothetical protein VK463_01525 [Desulfomonilaceae bacterium]|nr:hypothetical protein [Desulfomonilaceae bacterium]